MASRAWRLLSALVVSLVANAAGQPRCDGAPDFTGCAGNTDGFCPEDIECSCKDGRPFCSCPYYKGPNTDYWYMGSKCDSLWSTWDLVVIAVLPAVALAFVVAVSAQWIHYCKSKKEPRKESQATAHHNPSFVPEAQSRSLYEDFPRAELYGKVVRNKMPAEPSRINPYSENRASAYGDQRLMPQPDYDHYDQHPPQPHFPQVRLGAPGLPRTAYEPYTDGWANRSGR